MGCACSKSLYEYSMDSSTEDLIKSYEQTNETVEWIVEKTIMYFYHRHQKVVANLLGKLWVVISGAVDYTSRVFLEGNVWNHQDQFGGSSLGNFKQAHFDSFYGLSWRTKLICVLLRPPGLTIFAAHPPSHINSTIINKSIHCRAFSDELFIPKCAWALMAKRSVI